MKYTVYTDGSYKKIKGIGEFYSSAATLASEVNPDQMTVLTKVSNDDLISMHNVAGEIMAVMMALEHCINVLHLTQKDEVTIYYDYAGIENWTRRKGESNYWRCKNETTQAYRDYINTIVRPRFQLVFRHVSGHTGEEGNERVDRLARKAIDDHVSKLMEHK